MISLKRLNERTHTPTQTSMTVASLMTTTQTASSRAAKTASTSSFPELSLVSKLLAVAWSPLNTDDDDMNLPSSSLYCFLFEFYFIYDFYQVKVINRKLLETEYFLKKEKIE